MSILCHPVSSVFTIPLTSGADRDGHLALRSYFVFFTCVFITLVPQVILGSITYSQDELLNIRATSTHHHYDQEYDFREADPVFCPPPRTMDRIPAGEPKQRRRKRGKRSGLLISEGSRDGHIAHHSLAYYSPMSSLLTTR